MTNNSKLAKQLCDEMGEEADNSDMRGSLTYKYTSKYVWCSKCKKRLFKLEDEKWINVNMKMSPKCGLNNPMDLLAIW